MALLLSFHPVGLCCEAPVEDLVKIQGVEDAQRALDLQICNGMGPSDSVLTRGGGGSTVAVDYNASNLSRRVAIARSKRTMGDATPEDERGVLISKFGARTDGMG